MSSLIFIRSEHEVAVATDTLVVDSQHTPAFFTTKAFLVPHLQCIIAGTGVSGFAGRWFVEVNDRMAVRDLEHLDFHAPATLRRLWDETTKHPGFVPGKTSTIYHFGFLNRGGPMQVFAYKSTNGFQSEKLSSTLGVKPPCDPGDDSIPFPQRFVDLMLQQRREQEQIPLQERVCIGGEAQVIHLTRDGFSCYTLAELDDRAELMGQMLERHSQGR